ncbi:hypothetical protein NMG60_11008729 [Bertholletia excelsa]
MVLSPHMALAAAMDQRYESECKEIHDSWGKHNCLARALARRNQLARKQIRETYRAIYGEDLIERLLKTSQSSLSGGGGDVCEALSMWMLDPVEQDAVVAREALDHQTEINYMALIEMFVGRKSSTIVLIKQAYQSKFRRILDQDIVSIEPPNPFKKILAALVASHRAHHADVSQHIAKCDAIRLYHTGEGKSGTIDEAVVLEILSKRSIPQLKLIFSSYKHIYGHDYTKALKNEKYREFKDALKMVVKCMYNPPKYYAKALYSSIKGVTRDKGALARVMMGRAEVDLDEIQKVFEEKYGMELREAIYESESIQSGAFRDFLVALSATPKSSSTAISS